MKLLVVSETGHGLGLAMRLSSEGHNITFVAPEGNRIGDGIVPRNNLQTAPDIVFYDESSFGADAEALRLHGTRVLGASTWAEALGNNPDYMQGLIRSLGWETSGDEQGINYYITVWYNGANYLSTYTSLVYRRLMPGGQGPDVNFTGVVSNFWQNQNQKIKQVFLTPLERVLRKANHRGAFHIHAVLHGNDFWVKEISADFNHPLSLLLFENSKLSTSDVILRLFNEDSQPIAFIEQWAAGVLLSVPPYPHRLEGAPTTLRGILPANLKHLWLVDAMKQDSQWSSTGIHGKLGYVLARGASVGEAVKRAYRTISNLSIKDLQFRNDVGRDLHTILTTLKGYGWLR